MFGRRRRDAWVFLKGREGRVPVGATVEIAGRRPTRQAGLPRNAGGPYAWVVFPDVPYGDHTVRITYPSGVQQIARLLVSAGAHSITLEEPAAGGKSVR